jgi:hypothetical protein
MNDPDEAIEQRVWILLKHEAENEPGRSVRITRHADQRLPVPNKHWTKDVVKSWENRGLVGSSSEGAVAWLTRRGVDTDRVTDEP